MLIETITFAKQTTFLSSSWHACSCMRSTGIDLAAFVANQLRGFRCVSPPCPRHPRLEGERRRWWKSWSMQPARFVVCLATCATSRSGFPRSFGRIRFLELVFCLLQQMYYIYILYMVKNTHDIFYKSISQLQFGFCKNQGNNVASTWPSARIVSATTSQSTGGPGCNWLRGPKQLRPPLSNDWIEAGAYRVGILSRSIYHRSLSWGVGRNGSILHCGAIQIQIKTSYGWVKNEYARLDRSCYTCWSTMTIWIEVE